ncbi:MAG: hypothetical protein ACKVKH_18470, partial [Verrucomicrobiales bacterium]
AKDRAGRALEALDEEILSQQQKITDCQNDLQSLIKENGHPPYDKKDTVELSLKQHIYHQAKENIEQATQMLRELKIHHEKARTLLKKPHQPVTIYNRAE